MSEHEAKEQPTDISILQESFSQQQKKIFALKELLRKSGVAHGKSASSTQEKVKNIAQNLTNWKSMARSRQTPTAAKYNKETVLVQAPELEQTQNVAANVSLPGGSSSSSGTGTMSANISMNTSQSSRAIVDMNASLPVSIVSGSDKYQLLCQQMEENKARLAKRASSKQHLEQLFTQLKEQFDSTQQWLEDTTELGKSMSDLSKLDYTQLARERHKSATDLTSQPFSLEKERIKYFENRCRLLEKQLEKERQHNEGSQSSAIQASAMHVKELEANIEALEALLKEREVAVENTMAENETLRQEIAKNSEVPHTANQETSDNENEVSDLRNENEQLRCQLKEKSERITAMEEVNDILETTCADLAVKAKRDEEQLESLKQQLAAESENLQQVRHELRNVEVRCMSLEDMLEKQSNSTKAVPDTDSQVKAEMAKQIQELMDNIEVLRQENEKLKEEVNKTKKLEVSDETIAEKILALEATIESQRDDLKTRSGLLKKCEEVAMEKTIELNVLQANFKVLQEKLEATNRSKALFSVVGTDDADAAALQAEYAQLKQKLDESNKAMIKLKLKCRHAEKQIEKLKKTSDLHAEVIKLSSTNEQLQAKIVELEDEKGQWQLLQVDDVKDTGEKKAHSIAESVLDDKQQQQTETIKALEQQNFEQSQKLSSMQQQLEVLQQQINNQQDNEEIARVKSQMSEIHLEEQLEEQTQQIKALEERLSSKDIELEELTQKYNEASVQKQDADKKLEHYISENMELLDKVEKLSKSSSSAESIEIVERLTQQERAEIDEFNKRLEHENVAEHAPNSVDELTQTEIGGELSESLSKLREESNELMNKIELFTTERREVLDKMELLTTENHELLIKIEQLTREKEILENNAHEAEEVRSKLEIRLQEVTKEKELLEAKATESMVQQANLSQELSSLQKSSETVAALDRAEGATLFDKCEKSLSKLNAELESYSKAHDKNAKFNASKKLAKEAKNVHVQLSELLLKVKEASTAVETVTVVETVVAVTAPNGKALAEYEQLTAQNRELKTLVEQLRQELKQLHRSDTEPAKEDDSPTAIDLSQFAEHQEKLQAALAQVISYKEECVKLQNTIDDLRQQLQDESTENQNKAAQIVRLNDELASMQKMSEDFDRLINDKEMAYEKQIEQLTRLRRELEGKCDMYEGEIEILQTLVTEQKQHIIEAYKESEHEINLKLLELQQQNEDIAKLQRELKEIKEKSTNMGQELSSELQSECKKLRDSLRINKALLAEQVDELANKQETIETLNQQMIDLYRLLEKQELKLADKEDKIIYLQDLVDNNNLRLVGLQKDNDEQKSVVDKLLSELHSHKASTHQLQINAVELRRLEQENAKLEAVNNELKQRNKEQLEKLKKYAANLKKRTLQCNELEAQVGALEKGALEAMQSKSAEEDAVPELQQRIEQLQRKLEDSEAYGAELSKAVQIKTLEHLEAIECTAKAESELEQTRQMLMQKTNDIVQLQNALAASKPELVQPTESQLRELTEKSLLLTGLQEDLRATQEKLLASNEQLFELRSQLSDAEQRIAEQRMALDNKQLEVPVQVAVVEHMRAEDDNIESLKQQLDSQATQLKTVNQELTAKALKFEKSKAVIKERNNQIQRLQALLADLQSKLSQQPEEVAPPTDSALKQMQEKYESLQEAYERMGEKYAEDKTCFQETIARLETLHDGIQAKLHENKSYIETLEEENAKFKSKICKLEECVDTFEQRRASLEQRTNILNEQLRHREDEFGKTEDHLIHRLNTLSDHDDLIGRRLLEAEVENENLQQRLDQLQLTFGALQADYSKMEYEFHKYRESQEHAIQQHMSEKGTLQEQLTVAKEELQHARRQCDAKLAAKATEIDELECDLSDQLERLNAEKRAIAEGLEKARDECTEQKDEIVCLRDSLHTLEQAKLELERKSTWLQMQNENSQQDQYELQELRMQSMQDKTELENLRHQIDSLMGNHEMELQALRIQISELDSLRMQVGQNQTDDQVFIESENKRLTDLLAEKELLIENYQRQNLQLQMSATAASQSPNVGAQTDAFTVVFNSPLPTPPSRGPVSPSHQDERERLERELAEKTELIARLGRELNTLQNEFHSTVEGNTEMERQRLERNRDIENMNVIPAPPMFFGSDQMMPSPFDELIQARSNEHTLDAARPSEQRGSGMCAEQPTIEDLQRNVSDLEKHAQELENKLTMRNNREAEQEERLRETQMRLHDAEMRAQELQVRLEATLQSNQQEWQQFQRDYALLKESEGSLQLLYQQQQIKLREAEQQLCERDEHLTANTDNPQLSMEQQTKMQELLAAREQQVDELTRGLDAANYMLQNMGSLESQIIEPAAARPAKNTSDESAPPIVQPNLDMFFGSCTQDFIVPEISPIPVIEDVIVPEKAYVCQPDSQEAVKTPTTPAANSANVFTLGDDWNDPWGSSEATAEAAHFANMPTTLVPREQQLEIQLQEEAERIQKLQMALERCEQEKQELQVKSGKLMKKLKEYKVKIEELQTAANARAASHVSSLDSNSMFGDLDAAIQEELRNQIRKLEGRLDEQSKMQDNFVVEKEKLLKRIDVLTAGNDRMSEMKERQDMDVEMYKTRIRELQQKISKLEDWDAEHKEPVASDVATRKLIATVQAAPFDSTNTADQSSSLLHLEQKIVELTAEVQDANADRLELQALLDDEKANTARAEETLQSLQQQLTALENACATNEDIEKSKHNDLKLQYQALQESHSQMVETNTRLEQELQKLQQFKTEAELTAETKVQQLELTLTTTQQALSSNEASLAELQAQNLQMSIQNKELLQANEELRESNKVSEQIEHLQSELQRISSENEALCVAKAQLEHETMELRAQVQKLSAQNTVSATDAVANIEEMVALLQEKESEILHLKQRIEDLMREDQTEKLVLEILTKNQEIHMLKMQVKHLEEDKQELEQNVALQITKEIQISKETQESQLQQQVQSLELQLRELRAEKNNMEEELRVLNNHVIDSLGMEEKLKVAALELDAKNVEIVELRASLESLKARPIDESVPINPLTSMDIDALNAHWVKEVELKCGEIAQMWREHLEHREQEYKFTEANLQKEIAALRAANSGAVQTQEHEQSTATKGAASVENLSALEVSSASDSPSAAAFKENIPLHTAREGDSDVPLESENDSLIAKMRSVLETQEMEIVTLKEQLAIRSAEYARLAAQYDPYKLHTTSSHSGMTPMAAGAFNTDTSANNTSGRQTTGDPQLVPKSELDLALYMLHQRDMRCEEMTLELVSLLEERDTLQLKLSNTLRQIEGLKSQTTPAESTSILGDGVSLFGSNDSPNKSISAGPTNDSSSHELNHKLSQLQTVHHSKDKVIKEERDERIRQMVQIQQDMAKIPPAAVSELVGADYSQTNQLPSSVLLNWLFGKKPGSPGEVPPN